MLFDTHAHYDSNQFKADRMEVLSALPQAGVGLVVNPGCDLATSRTAVELSETFPHVYAAVGVHPGDCGDWQDSWLTELEQLAREHQKVRAIGEIGLDYYWKDNPPREHQKHVFHAQMDLAEKLGLPIIVHDREAHGDCLEAVQARQDPGENGVDALLYRGGHLQKRPQGPGGTGVAAPGPDHD